MRNVTQIQQFLIEQVPPFDVGPYGADGTLGFGTLKAINAFLASKSRPEIVGRPTLIEINAAMFPEDTPPKPVSNPLDNPLVKIGLSILIPQLLKGLPMGNIFNVLSGAKTYIAGTAMLLTGIADYVQPGIVPGSGSFTPLAWGLGGLVVIGGRNALATALASILEKLTGTDPANLPK